MEIHALSKRVVPRLIKIDRPGSQQKLAAGFFIFLAKKSCKKCEFQNQRLLRFKSELQIDDISELAVRND